MLKTYIEGLDIGNDVSVMGLLTAVTDAVSNPAQPSFALQGLVVGKQDGTLGVSDIDILFNEAASVGNITVNEVS